LKGVYVDTSVVLRMVLDEPRQLAAWNELEEPVTGVLTKVEGLRTIDRATRRATHPRKRPLREKEANAARALLYETLEMFDRIELSRAILARAGQLAGPLGTLDALHLATALCWSDSTGVTAVMATHGPELAQGATSHGLPVLGSIE
jgi:predicted nucleic acid-binding protein